MRLDPTNILGGIFEDDSHTDTCLLGKGWRTLILHKYSGNISRFSEDIGQLELPIVNATYIARTEYEDEVIIRINQALSKPDEEVLLMSTLKIRYNVTRSEKAPMQFDTISQIALRLRSEEQLI